MVLSNLTSFISSIKKNSLLIKFCSLPFYTNSCESIYQIISETNLIPNKCPHVFYNHLQSAYFYFTFLITITLLFFEYYEKFLLSLKSFYLSNYQYMSYSLNKLIFGSCFSSYPYFVADKLECKNKVYGYHRKISLSFYNNANY